MPQVQIYINNQLCDLKGDEEISVDYAIFDITKIGSRGGARSYEFSLPKTNRNKSVLENPEMVNNLSEVPYTRLPCLILVDGVDVLIRFAEVSTVKDDYKIRVYGSNSDLFSILAQYKLIDIDWTDLDEIWTQNTMVGARTRTEGIIYPVIDYNEDSPNFAINNYSRSIRSDYTLPCVFVNDILERIFEHIGWDYINEIEDDFELIMPLLTRAPSDVANDFLNEKYEGTFGMYARQEIPYVAGLANQQVFAFDFVTGNTGTYYSLPYVMSNGNRCVRIVDGIFFDVTYSIDITFSSANPTNPLRNSVTFYTQIWNRDLNPLFVAPGTVKTFNNNPDGLVNFTWTQRYSIFDFPGTFEEFNFTSSTNVLLLSV